MMGEKAEEKERHSWRAWVTAALASAFVFGLLAVIQEFSFWGAIAAAVVIVGGGLASCAGR